jgi:DNA repair exonuclease SbcCD ATPase subunit
MIIFKTLKWKNLLSTGNYWTEINLNQTQNTLVVGENGSGKSTMLDALCFVLFGKAFRNINKPNLLNSINQKDCVVEIHFDIGSKNYKVVRGIKPNVFQIFQNGDLLNQDAASKDYQEILEDNILKLNYKSFTQIVILGSASFVPFMQLSAADRRAIIEDLLDIQIFSTMNNIVKDRVSNTKDLINNKKHEIQIQQKVLELKQEHINQLKQNNNEKIKELRLDFENNNRTIENLLSNVTDANAKVVSLNEMIGNKLETEAKIKKISKFETQIENNLTKFRKDISFFSENDSCPTCRQTIEESFKQQELVNLDEKVRECEHGLEKLTEKLNEEQEKLNEISKVQKTIQELQVKIATDNTTIQQINKNNEKLEKQINDLTNCKTLTDKEQSELDKIIGDMDQLKQDLKSLLEEQTYYETASILLKDTGIKTKIVKQYLPVINKLVNKYLSSLDFFVNFNLDESFKETIKSRHRDDFSYNNFSEGEKQRIDMALMLTWRAVAKLKNSTNTNLLILDEVFDSSLDNNGTEYLMNILHMLDDVNLFVISHKGDILQDKFANVIRFQKIKNFSRVSK